MHTQAATHTHTHTGNHARTRAATRAQTVTHIHTPASGKLKNRVPAQAKSKKRNQSTKCSEKQQTNAQEHARIGLAPRWPYYIGTHTMTLTTKQARKNITTMIFTLPFFDNGLATSSLWINFHQEKCSRFKSPGLRCDHVRPTFPPRFFTPVAAFWPLFRRRFLDR